MISKYLWFGIVVLHLSLSKNSLYEYSMRGARSTYQSTPFDISKIERFDPELCLDLGLFVSQTIITELEAKQIDPKKYLDDIILRSKKMFLWHNIKLRISEFEIFTTDPFPHTNRNDQDLDSLITLLQNRNSKNDVNMYIKDYRNSTTDQKGGYAYTGSACSKGSVGTFNFESEKYGFDAPTEASIITHEIGHQIGFSHGDSALPGCECAFPKLFCLGPTEQNNPFSDIPKNFENCLINKLKNSLASFPCLKSCENIPEKEFCGDGIVNGDEKCDCGFGELCKLLKKDKCCNPKTCQYKQSDFQCDEGECCENCKFSKYKICSQDIDGKGTKGVCKGSSSKCVEETKLVSVTSPKLLNKAQDKLCVQYLGEGNYYSDRCYEHIEQYINHYCTINKLGSEFYEKDCKHRSSICENFVCEGNKIQMTDEIASVNYGNYFCNYYRTSHGKTSFGAHNGVKCSNNKYCRNYRCRKNRKVETTVPIS